MADERVLPTTVEGWHRWQAVEANNAAMALLDEADPDPRDLLRGAYAAAYHWDRVPTKQPVNEVRALYMIGKAWVKVGEYAMGLSYARRMLAACLADAIVDFDLAYAHELHARALLGLGRETEGLDAVRAAWSIPVADREDAGWVAKDLADLPELE